MTGTRHTGAPHSRQDTLIGMRNCLEFLAHEAKGQDLSLTHWLLRMAIASLDEEMTSSAARPLDVVADDGAAQTERPTIRRARAESGETAQQPAGMDLEPSHSAVD